MSRTPEYTAQLAALASARQAAEVARQAAYAKSQAHQKLGRVEAQAARGKSGSVVEGLAQETAAAKTEAGRAWEVFGRSHEAQLGVLQNLAPLLDPRDHAGQMDDGYPILMMPLRLETRFAPDAGEFWIRAYPDAWAVDGFEEKLSEVEVTNAQIFWTGYWAAAGRRDLQLAAWRNLAANHGAGRAQWICTSYRPANEGNAPGTGDPAEKVLILDSQEPGQADSDAIAAYWQAIWRAPGDTVAAETVLSDLTNAIGEPAAPDAAQHPPRNLTDHLDPVARDQVPVRVAWISWPALTGDDVKATGWSEAARADVLPERLVVTLTSGENSRSEIGNVIPSTVALGFDPSAPDAEQIAQVNGELTLPEAMQWIFDFDKAVEIGLGFRITLSSVEQSAGFDRIVVAGVSLRDDSADSKAMLERLIEHHSYSGSGVGLLPQGTPTNNSETPSGYSERDNIAEAFDRQFGDLPDLAVAEKLDRPDGQWLAHWLGIGAKHVAALPFADGRDQGEARAMNRLLWPATIGYSLDTLMADILSEDTVEDTRRYFEDYVLARDCLPQIRIGDQPYGILPATAWSRQNWYFPRVVDDANEVEMSARRQSSEFFEGLFGSMTYPARLASILRQADTAWDALVPGAAHVGRDGDLHQTLLDILGLAPNSLEFYRRQADSHEHYFNLLRAQGLGGLFQIFRTWAETEAAKNLLRQSGWKGDGTPEVLRYVFHEGQQPLRHILVDDVEPSETAPIRVYTDNDTNYMHWLVNAGETSLEALRQQAGFLDDDVPNALLYNLARHALQLSYWDLGMRLHRTAPQPVLSADELKAARREPALMHIAQQDGQSSSRYLHLYRPAQTITGDATMLLQDHIAQIWQLAPEAAAYRRVLGSLRHLSDVPTARLERLVVEHLDLCTYRLDAWRQGILHMQLDFMRTHLRGPGVTQPGSAPVADIGFTEGLYLGAFGWLEDVRPRQTRPEAAEVPEPVRDAFDANARPMLNDPQNQGYIHAPSLDQAQTAAVLRSTYLSAADEDNPGTMAIKLSSWRVRQAMAVLEGLRNDQSLGELLGYRFERELHENFELAETDEFIFALRNHFPLVANKIKTTYQDLQPGDTIESIEARNVVDGEALIDHMVETGETTYPFGLDDMPAADAAQSAKIDAAADRLRNVADAVADLALAESVYQAMKGKPDSAAASLDAQGSGLFPPVSEFVATPREGITITSRTALFLDSNPPLAPAWAGVADTQRALAEPVLNHWLASVFPAPETIGFEVHNVTQNSTEPVTLDALGGQPIDWFYDLDLDDREAMTALNQRVKDHFRTAHAPVHPRDRLEVLYRSAPAGTISLFGVALLISTARDLVNQGRALEASDIALNNDSRERRQGSDPVLPRARADDALLVLDALKADLESFVAPLETHLQDTEANATAIRTGLAAQLTAFTALVDRAQEFGLTELDRTIGMRWRRQWFRAVENKLDALIADWERRLTDFHGFVARADAVPPSATFSDIFRPLQRAERQIATKVTAPLPVNPATMRADLATRVATFETRLTGFRDLRAMVTDNAHTYLTAFELLLPISDFTPDEVDLTEALASFVRPTAEMNEAVGAALAAIAKRQGETGAALTAHDTAVEARDAVDAVQAALQALFGESFVALPQFTFGAEQQAELTLCHSDRANLIRHQRDTLDDLDPLDTWLNGSARVRDRIATLEGLSVLREALTGTDTALDAWQLPHVADDHWLGASYPDTHTITGDKLLVQAHHSVAFASGATQCGLLIDEWTEVIPTEEITTGVAFHFDQPNSEPPQAMLLMTPPNFQGSWQWDDIVAGLNETLGAAKTRAVEPDQIDTTPYALFLPATLASAVHHPLTVSLNYAVMNNYARVLAEEVN